MDIRIKEEENRLKKRKRTEKALLIPNFIELTYL